MIFYYKDRTIDVNKPVFVYRKLYKNSKKVMFSIKQNGLVVGHSNNFTLNSCTVVINESGRKRCLKTGVRNVHAYIKGFVCETNDVQNFEYSLKYNPHMDENFWIKPVEGINNERFKLINASFIYFRPTGAYI